MEKKVCSKCNIEKELCEFGKRTSAPDGLSYHCKECRNSDAKRYVKENKETIIEKRKFFYQKNKNKILSLMKDYYSLNDDKIKKRTYDYKQNNPEKVKETTKKYYEKNKDEINKKSKKYQEDNKETQKQKKSQYKKQNRAKYNKLFSEKYNNDFMFKLITLVRCRVRNFLKRKNINKSKKTFEIVGCSPEQLKEHIEKQFTDGMCWEKIGKYIHIDHIIPLASAKTEEEVLKLCHYTNLQPLWAEDNLKKRDKIIY